MLRKLSVCSSCGQRTRCVSSNGLQFYCNRCGGNFGLGRREHLYADTPELAKSKTYTEHLQAPKTQEEIITVRDKKIYKQDTSIEQKEVQVTKEVKKGPVRRKQWKQATTPNLPIIPKEDSPKQQDQNSSQ